MSGDSEAQGLSPTTTTSTSQTSFDLQSTPSRLSVKNKTVFQASTRDILSTDALAKRTAIQSPTTTLENRLLVVGTTCGVLGLLFGVAVSVAFWIYKKRCGNNRHRKSSASEKNPKEMTFEPLDLTLTLPRYESSISTNSGVSDRQTRCASALRYANQYRDNSAPEKFTSYQSFELPSPPARNNERQRADLSSGPSWDEFSSIHSSTLTSIKTNSDVRKQTSVQREKRAATITTRESISSGLGTATESELNFSEIRAPQTANMTTATNFIEGESPKSRYTGAKYNTTGRPGGGTRTENHVIGTSHWQASTYPKQRNSLPFSYDDRGSFDGFPTNRAFSNEGDVIAQPNWDESDSIDAKTCSVNSIASTINEAVPASSHLEKDDGYVTVIRRSSDATINL